MHDIVFYIDWEKVFNFLASIDWVLVLKLICWVGIPYIMIIGFGFLYTFLKSKMWWTEEYFKSSIELQLKKGVPIHYNKSFNRYELKYSGFYFSQFIFLKRDNDCRVIVEGNRAGFLFKLFEDSEFNLNLDKIEDYMFFKKICDHCKDKPEKKETNYTISWLKEEIKKYGSYKGDRT